MSKLKNIREKQHLTQEELSEKSGISVRTIQRIESGNEPKGYTLRVLASALQIPENELLNSSKNTPAHISSIENNPSGKAEEPKLSFQIKLINLASLAFFIPFLNIFLPWLLANLWCEKNPIVKQIVSLQMIWTILAPIIFMLGVLMKLGSKFTLLLIIALALSNIFIILRNAFEIDKNNKLHYVLNFNLL